MTHIESRPKPTTFDLSKVDEAQLIVDPSRIGEQVCRNLMGADPEKSKGQPFVYIFVIRPNRTVLVMTQGGDVGPSRKTTRSMDRAMDLWSELERDGWSRLDADFWYGGIKEATTPKRAAIGIVSHATASRKKALIGIEGKVCDLGYGYCVLSILPIPVSPTFHVRRRMIIPNKV